LKKPPAIAVGTKLPPLAKRVSDAHVDLAYRRLLLLAEKLDVRFKNYIKGPNIHTSDDAARAAGFSRRVAPGFHSYSFISEMLCRFFGLGWATGGKIRLKFVRPFYVNEQITCEAEVTKTAFCEKSGERYADLEVCCKNSKGDIITVGSARARIQLKP